MQTQTEALIEAIEKNPGISRSELSDVRTGDGFRIANFTARITDARNLLSKVGKAIVCTEGGRLKGHRTTTYEIKQVIQEV